MLKAAPSLAPALQPPVPARSTVAGSGWGQEEGLRLRPTSILLSVSIPADGTRQPLRRQEPVLASCLALLGTASGS